MYYVISNGTQFGPYSLDKISRLVAAGQLKAQDFAWAEGMTKKVPLHALLANPASCAPAREDPYESPGNDASAARPSASGNSGLATGSRILGILAIVLASSIYVRILPIQIAVYGGLGAGLVAVVMGHMARRGVRRSQGRIGGAGAALAGLICGYMAIVPSGLLVVSAFGYRFIMNRGRSTKAEANIATIVSYIDMYAAKNNRRPPSMAEGLGELVTQRFITDPGLLTDPWGVPIRYKVPASRSRGKYDVWSSGPDHISGNEDDIGNWKSED